VVIELRRSLSFPLLRSLQAREQALKKSLAQGPVGMHKKHKKKKKKDPNAPKGASNSYMIFCKDRRQELKKSQPELSFGHLGSKLGIMWRNLSEEQKAPYEEKARLDKERYNEDMTKYVSLHGFNTTLDADEIHPHKRSKVKQQNDVWDTPNAFAKQFRRVAPKKLRKTQAQSSKAQSQASIASSSSSSASNPTVSTPTPTTTTTTTAATANASASK
jgi:hypothetical protein